MKQKVLVGALVIVLIVGAWYMLFFKSETSHIASLRSQQQQAQGRVAELDATYVKLLASKTQQVGEAHDLATLDKLIPQNPDLDTLITTLSKAAKQSGVSVTGISSPQPAGFGGAVGSAPTTPVVGPATVALTVSISGLPARILAFISRLNEEPRLFVVDNLPLTFPAPAPKSVAAGKTSATIGSASTPVTTSGTNLQIRAFYTLQTSDTPAS